MSIKSISKNQLSQILGIDAAHIKGPFNGKFSLKIAVSPEDAKNLDANAHAHGIDLVVLSWDPFTATLLPHKDSEFADHSKDAADVPEPAEEPETVEDAFVTSVEESFEADLASQLQAVADAEPEVVVKTPEPAPVEETKKTRKPAVDGYPIANKKAMRSRIRKLIEASENTKAAASALLNGPAKTVTARVLADGANVQVELLLNEEYVLFADQYAAYHRLAIELGLAEPTPTDEE